MILKWPVRVKPEGERGLDLMRLLIPTAVFLAALSSGTAGAQAQPGTLPPRLFACGPRVHV